MVSIEKGIYNWEKHDGPDKPIRRLKSCIEIDDETWRDGMQGTQVVHHPTTEQKMHYIKTAAELGYVDHFDIGFPASGSLQRDEIVHLIEASKKTNLTFSAAGRGAAVDDVKAIIEVAQRSGKEVEADLFLDASSLRSNIEQWDRNEKLRQLRRNIVFAKREGLPVMFVPERASATSPQELLEVCVMAADEGVDRIAIADTTGVLTPYGTSKLLRTIFEEIGKKYTNIKFDFHEHQDLNMGIANCITAAMEGVDRLHATARGIGERAGNVELEQLLVVLNLQGFRDVKTSQIQAFAKMAANILSLPIGSHESIVGEKSTETASGVHASTYEKVRKGGNIAHIYFPYNPEDVGLKPRVRVGPLSGLANVYAYCAELGIRDVTEEKAREILDIAKKNWGLLSEEDIKNVLGRGGDISGK